MSDKETIHRIAKRGMRLAHERDPNFVDIFQHLLDELDRVIITPKSQVIREVGRAQQEDRNYDR